MSFQMIPGQDRAKRMLQNGLRSGKLSHAYIFSGPSGTGRKEMAVKLAQAVFCTESEDDACGQCIECRKVEHRNHPNLLWIEPEGASVKIEQVRELQKELGYKASQGKKKIYVIDQADRLTVQAANSLLKFFEEPGSDVMAILITESGQALLPTIQSRAQWIPFFSLDPKERVRILHESEGFPLELVLPAIQLTGGLEAARAFIQSKEFAEARNVVLQLSRETLTRFPHVMITAQQEIFKGDMADRLPLLLDLWLLWFKDMIRLHCAARDNLIYIDQTDWMAREAVSRSISYWVQGMEQVLDMQKKLRFHANPQLALEKLIVDLQGG